MILETTDSNGASELRLDEDIPADKIVIYALDEACSRLEDSGDLVPFTVVLHGEELYVEDHPGNTVSQCFDSAHIAVHTMRNLADAYCFAYDGYVDMDEGRRDAVIVERGMRGGEPGTAFAVIYTEGDEGFTFDEDVCVLGDTPSLLDANATGFIDEISDDKSAASVPDDCPVASTLAPADASGSDASTVSSPDTPSGCHPGLEPGPSPTDAANVADATQTSCSPTPNPAA
jgi:hypothetical protein